MVLGLGSRSKKDRASAITQLVELDIHIHEIKPWLGLAKLSKVPMLVAMRWGRGERLIGSTRNVNPTAANGPEMGKIILGESLRIAVAPNREILKRAKKSYPDLDEPLVFTLLDMNDPKGKPLAQAALDLSSLASITESKLVAVPFTASKKVAKGGTSYLHLTVQRYQDDKAATYAGSASLGTSGRTSDASSLPPLDEDTQQMLVAALMSGDEDDHNNKEEDIDSFTDDDDDGKKEVCTPNVASGSSPAHTNVDSRLPQQNASTNAVGVPAGNVYQRVNISATYQAAEKQPEKVEEKASRQPVASPQASPVKAAAIAAAAAYTKKHSFLPRRTKSYMNDSDDSISDLDSAGEDEFPSRFSRMEQSPSLPPKGPPKIAAHLQVNSFSGRGSETLSNVLVDKRSQEAVQEKVIEAAATKAALKESTVNDVKSKFNGQCLVSANSAISTIMHQVKTVDQGRVGATERDESKGPANTITTENIFLSSTKESNTPSMDSRSELEASLDMEVGFQRSFNNENTFSRRVETIQAKSLVTSDMPTKTTAEPKPKAAVKSPLREKGTQKTMISKSPDKSKGRTNQSPVQDSRTSKTAMQEAKLKTFKSPDRENEKGDKKVAEDNKQKVLHIEGKGVTGQSRIQQLEAEVEKLKGELRDVAAVEAALYSTTAEHGSSSLKLHAPARRLARVYIHACKHWSQERRASYARNTTSGLILTARACGNDVARLTFWWSNTTVLREIISTASSILPASPQVSTLVRPSEGKTSTSSPNSKKLYQKQQTVSPSHDCEDWREPITFTCALERLESWIYTKVVESIWWQVLTPQMQQPIKQASVEIEDNAAVTRLDHGNHEKRAATPELEDARQGNASVDIWKKAFLDAYERLCPVRVLGVECGCLPMLNKLVLEACVIRLDVAMFNGILRDDETPTDPVSDPISDVRVLPIPNSSLSFGLGAQLKNAVATLSSFILQLTRKDDNNVMSDGMSDDEEKSLITFPLLKAMGGLLMLPKDMLIDKSLRKEVCPTLQLSFIGRILSKFQPDEFSPEPLTPELLETINAEVAAEQEDMDDSVTTFRMAFSPSIVYNPPQSNMVRHWIGDVSTNNRLNRTTSSILRKGHTSDDEIDELESPISWLWDNTMGSSRYNRRDNGKGGAINSPKDGGENRRFMLLREVWNSS
ncbi:hypothetical protein GOP47_0010633 [Adiantum capillus-veneris]|uniref:C2 NT-type domain-containing protein n=1 Tax=Adiantum capillus-veneris TaxID=13818 RepID=A0A9D4UVP1_ADICA|nr:hypothetical protein GOP47_0010633 [Adiantum capillus-veneris]